MRWQLFAVLLIVALSGVDARADDATIEKLTKGLTSPTAAARIDAAKQLGEMDAKKLSKSTLEALAQATLDRNPDVRRAVKNALRKLDIPQKIFLPIIVAKLKDADPSAVMPALHTLAEDGAQAVPKLIGALKDDEACYWACLVLADIGPEAKDAVPHLIPILSHKMPECRVQALEALAKIGPSAKSAGPAIAKLLESDEFGGVRYSALFALGKTGAKDSLASVKKALKTEDPVQKLLAAWAQLQLDTDNDDSVTQSIDIILAGLNSQNATVRELAVEAIQESDAPTVKVAPALIKALQGGDEEFVENVVSAMASRGSGVAERIGRGLKNEGLREFAIRVVTRMGPQAKSLVPQLVSMMKEGDVEFQREVHFALGAIGPAAAPAVPKLMAALDSDELKLKYSAAYALGSIGPQAKDALPKLRANLKAEDEFLRVSSVWAMLQIRPKAERIAKLAVPLLTKALSNEREMVRVEIAKSLGNLGETAASAVPTLKKLAESDASLLVRETAAEAIRKIQ